MLSCPNPANNGNTPLHDLICRSPNSIDFNAFVAKYSLQVTKQWLCTVNDAGKTPLLCLPTRAEVKLVIQMINLMKDCKVKYLHTLICQKNLLSEYKNASSQFKNNLRLACAATNHARSVLLYSPSHPDANGGSLSLVNEQINQIDALHQQALVSKQIIFKCPLPLPADDLHFLNSIKHKVKLHGAKHKGNCREFACFVFDYIQTQTNNFHLVEIFQIENGSHCFAVIGRDQKSNPREYKTWGKNTVICDAWLGEIYGVEAMEEKLRTHIAFKVDEKIYNVLLSFNPKFHTLAPSYSIKIQPTLSDRLFLFFNHQLNKNQARKEETEDNTLMRKNT